MTVHRSDLSPSLLVVPTIRELEHFKRQAGFDDLPARTELCGFGSIAAAARTAQLLATHHVQRVLLAGIAGTYDSDQLDVSQAACFSQVAVYGIGRGASSHFTPASAMGFAQWPGNGNCESVGDVIALQVGQSEPAAGLLLSCCAASSSAVDIEQRLAAFPSALAEDMEGFGVAMACRLSNVPLTIVRGISNRVGDTLSSRWKIAEAMDAAWQLVDHLLSQPSSGSVT